MTASAPHVDVVQEGRRVVELAKRHGATVRLLGGAAIRLRAGERLPRALRRTPVDIDLVGSAECGPGLTTALSSGGYRPDEAFNQLEGYRRLLFFDDANGRQLDVFVADFSMCHTVPIGDRLAIESLTLPLAELVLTKLQIVELNAKDRDDLYALLATHDAGGGDGETINAAHVARVCARDWGLHRTATLNLDRLGEHLAGVDLDGEARQRVVRGIETLRSALEAEPKTRGWRLRARIGERVRWYELPEEVGAR